AHDGPMLEYVELVALAALALRIVGIERLVADQARVGDAVLDRIIERIAPDRLPGELAAHPEPAHVPAHEQLMAGCNLHPDPSAKQGVDPVDRAGLRDRAIALQIKPVLSQRAGQAEAVAPGIPVVEV